jgi:acetylglutamate synthase
MAGAKGTRRHSLKKTLDHENYFACLEASLRFVILAGDHQAAVIVKDEKEQNNEG